MKPSRNLWPLGIILTFVIFTSGTICLIILACSHRVDLVSADYYEQEIRFQSRIDQAHRASRLNDPLTIAYDATSQCINLSWPKNPNAPLATGQVQLYRPSASGLDRHFALQLDREGNQSVSAKSLQPGLWKVRVSWSVGNEEFFADQSVCISAAKI
jgi:nitrogen fixation protein FixH